MAAAYAALLSLTHLIENIQYYGNHLMSLDKNLIESVHQRISFLQDFLEVYNSHKGSQKIEILESQIRDAAHAAEDIIESHIVNPILDYGSTTSTPISRDLHIVIEIMDFIKKEVMEIEEEMKIGSQPLMNPLHVASSSATSIENNTMIGFEDVMIEILERLTGEGYNRQIIPIVGMGGIGKTTLARNVYVHPITIQYFDIVAWVTISQEFSVRDIIFGLLNGIGVGFDKREGNIGEDQLGEILYKKLSGMRYLIVMDDIWSIEAWEKVRMFLPSNNNGSRIMMTTRLSNVANGFGFRVVEMGFLDEDESWSLFCEKVFAQEECSRELEEIGKKIVKSCKGLPLSIVVIGGLLAKSSKTQEYWDYVAENVNSTINLEDGGHCLKILYLSYVHLPIHLKPCFLYLGVFPEDHEIDVYKLVRIWVAEGFLKPMEAKTSEEVAEGYLRDLVDRNLVLVRKKGSRGKIKTCNIHDLLRELCLREAQKEKFLHFSRVHNFDNPLVINSHRRQVIHDGIFEKKERVYFQPTSLTRSLICDFHENLSWNYFELLRVLNVISHEYATQRYFFEDMLQLVNSRYFCFRADWRSYPNSFPSIQLFWNLQTLIVSGTGDGSLVLPSEIWTMRQLRHLKIDHLFFLPDPPVGHTDKKESFILENLQTLAKVASFKCSEEFVERVPNIKKLRIFMDWIEGNGDWSPYCLINLYHLHKLESLFCYFLERNPIESNLTQNLAFPRSLKKLTLQFGNLLWEDMTIIGSLPNLEVLRLSCNAFTGSVWNPIEREFLRLKFLRISASNLENWIADNTHFPCLECLVLAHMNHLEEVPLGFADIPTLRLIKLKICTDSSVISARRLLDEGESLGNEDLRVRIRCTPEKQNELESLACPTFTFYYN